MYNCKVYQECGTASMTLLNNDYKSLKDIAEALGLTYQQVADLSSRKEKKKYQQFKYFPEISITRIPQKKSIKINNE
tara:strand:- start:1954 stop:2184 length:231 start_codon:yes stop_codon:yes gene_type:complete